jgi:Carboxypeptidase regulatory-like domain
MTIRRFTIAATMLCALIGAATAAAQGSSTASISGVVIDSDGGVIPGADVMVKNVATGEMFTTISSEKGVFSVPALITGTYSVSVSLTGFKTAVLNNVIVNAGVPANVRATLEVGGLAEEVLVTANSALVPMQSATVATVLDTRQVASLPLSTRGAADFIVFLPGVTTPGGSRDSIVNGLPQSTINMTLDGVNIQDNTLKSTDGFFAIVNPRLDAVEEISFTSAAAGAESAGNGATQIRYTTKSGTNEFRGGAFHQYRSDALNTNTWFNKRDNLPKTQLLQNQPGFNIGGPVMLPGFDGHNRAFFFVNYEELRQPASTRRNHTIFHPDAERGIFRYSAAGGVQTVNLFELAARSGQTSTPDPIMSKLLADIRNATTKEGNVRDLTDPLYQEFSYLVPTRSMNHYPTVRLDYQLSARHRLTWSMNFQYFGGGPDTTNNREAYFPGFPVVADQWSTRRATSGWLRSIIGPTTVNELRVGYGGAPVIFAEGQFTKAQFSGPVANQGGFYLNMANALGLTASSSMNAGASGSTSGRDAYHYFVEDTLNWQKGAHSINVGGNYTQFELWQRNQNVVPELRFSVVQGDPAESMFVVGNFPGASTTNINNARALYAILTGRVSEVRGVARLNPDTGKYEYLGQSLQVARQRQLGFWLQDGWHVGPNFTLNYGARYDLSFPFISLNNSYSIGDLDDVYGISGVGNLFKPGVQTGQPPTFRQLGAGERAYPMDWNNLAPSIGFAWTPFAEESWLRHLTGGPSDFVVRAGYNRAYTRLGLTDFAGQVANNPGVSLNAFKQLSLGNLGPLPLLMRDPSRLGPADFPATPTFPYTEVVSGDITIFSPDLVVPLSDTWQAGITRALGSTMSVEVRYLGARSADNWRTNDYNELNIIENGFLDEFKLAMVNLQANNAAGGSRAGSFAYFGPGTGTSPLPIFLAYFNGVNRNGAGDASAYTSTNFRSTTYLNPLARFNPNPYSSATSLNGDATLRGRAVAAGLPSNFLLVNPDLLGGANIVENEGRTFYNSLALEFRRRAANGLSFQSSYVLGHATQSQFLSLRIDSPMLRNGGEEGDVSHAVKVNAVYPLPFGRNQRFGSGAGAARDRLIGGWQIAANARVQSGRLLDFGNVRLVGMTKEDLEKAFKLRIDAQGRVFMLPQDIIDETVKAFSVSPTSATGYGNLGAPSGRYIAPADSFDCIETIRGEGKCGVQSLIVQGPLYKQIDLSIVKRVELAGRFNAEFRLDALNVLDTVNFSPVSGLTATTNRVSGSAPTSYEVTALTGVNTARVLQIVSRIRW